MSEHTGSCSTVISLQAEVRFLKEQLKDEKDERATMMEKVSAVALDNATFKADIAGLKSSIETVANKFDRATWYIIGMFGSILVALILAYLKIK